MKQTKIISFLILTLLLTSVIGVFTPQTSAAPEDYENGFWTSDWSDVTDANLQLMLDGNVTYVFIRAGQWQADGTIDLIPSEANLFAAINATHTYGLEAFAWVIDDFYGVPIGTNGQRETAVASLLTLVDFDFGAGEKFDGIADDIELWHKYQDIIDFWNLATEGLHTLSKEYFTATIGYWFTAGEMTDQQISDIRVDRLQPMLYLEDYDAEIWTLTDVVMKELIIRILGNAYCLVGLVFTCDNVGGQSADSMTESMTVIDDAIDEVSTDYLAGFTVFAVDDSLSLMDGGQWAEWNAWTTKNVVHAGPLPTPSPTPIATATPTPTPAPTATDEINYVDNPASSIFYYVALCVALVIGAIISFIVFPFLGLGVGAIGLIATAYFNNAGVLIVNQYTNVNTLVTTYDLMPLGWFILAPIVLCILNIMIPIIKRGKR